MIPSGWRVVSYDELTAAFPEPGTYQNQTDVLALIQVLIHVNLARSQPFHNATWLIPEHLTVADLITMAPAALRLNGEP